MEIPVFEDSSPVYFLAISLGTSLQVYYWSLGKLVLKKLNRLRFDPSWVIWKISLNFLKLRVQNRSCLL